MKRIRYYINLPFYKWCVRAQDGDHGDYLAGLAIVNSFNSLVNRPGLASVTISDK